MVNFSAGKLRDYASRSFLRRLDILDGVAVRVREKDAKPKGTADRWRGTESQGVKAAHKARQNARSRAVSPLCVFMRSPTELSLFRGFIIRCNRLFSPLAILRALCGGTHVGRANCLPLGLT